jgi:hypothetical protein
VFKVARRLVRSPFVVVDPSPAAIFRGIDGRMPTLLIDEADMLKEGTQLKTILNSGFEPGSPVARAGKEYSTYCPKAFSGIAGDKQPLTDATLSRCIQIPMRRKAPHEHFEPLTPTAYADLEALRDEAEHCTPVLAGRRHTALTTLVEELPTKISLVSLDLLIY